jgi:tetratricopeptide (TPR) repeat protein
VLHKRSLMTNKSPSRPAGLPHAVFLQRVVADEPATSPEVRLGQGAFLALRFVDLLAPDREPPTPDVFRYQWAATERYCAELAGEGTEAAHLSGLVRATGEAHASGNMTLVAPALFAYALYLEQESHYEEAEDALDTMIRVGSDRLQVTDAISAWMRLGRVRRLQADFDGADVAYGEAGRIATTINDRRAALLSRVGRCNVLFFRGNLAEAERGWRAVLADSGDPTLRRVTAEAEHGLGTVLDRRGQPQDGAIHLWRAYESYEEESLKMRALKDLASTLLRLGDIDGAERALGEVIRRDRSGENHTNALIELMNCASYRRDRVGFERWRERCLEQLPNAAPNVRADYSLNAGIGYGRFENTRRARAELERALDIATAHGLHELEFRIERILNSANDCGAPDDAEGAAPLLENQNASLRELSASLAALGS